MMIFQEKQVLKDKMFEENNTKTFIFGHTVIGHTEQSWTNVEFSNLIPGKLFFWREIFAILRENITFR